jgi:hypothetical protein
MEDKDEMTIQALWELAAEKDKMLVTLRVNTGLKIKELQAQLDKAPKLRVEK